MMGSKNTFLVHVASCQNATWQGSITWLEEKESKHFRSLLEMIKLIDTAITPKAEEINVATDLEGDKLTGEE